MGLRIRGKKFDSKLVIEGNYTVPRIGSEAGLEPTFSGSKGNTADPSAVDWY